MFKSSNGLVVAGALAASMLFPISASALPFTFTIDSVSSFAPGFCTPSLTCAPDFKSITWKTPATPVSKLTVLDLTPQPIESDGSAVRITKLTHDNVIIPDAFSYVTEILNNIKLRAGAPPGVDPVLIDNSTSFKIKFTETVNAAPCVSPIPAGTICDDFFDFDASGLAPLAFSSGGLDYKLIFALETGMGTFFDGIRDDRIYTAEGQTSMLFVTARIVSVPEPMTLALLGLGLLGIGFTTRRRKM